MLRMPTSELYCHGQFAHYLQLYHDDGDDDNEDVVTNWTFLCWPYQNSLSHWIVHKLAHCCGPPIFHSQRPTITHMWRLISWHICFLSFAFFSLVLFSVNFHWIFIPVILMHFYRTQVCLGPIYGLGCLMLVCALNLPQSYTLTHPHVETDFLHIHFDFFSPSFILTCIAPSSQIGSLLPLAPSNLPKSAHSPASSNLLHLLSHIWGQNIIIIVPLTQSWGTNHHPALIPWSNHCGLICLWSWRRV